MSEAKSALGGRSYSGFVTVADAGLIGMVSLRADLSAAATAKAVKAALGLGLPEARRILAKDDTAVAWMSPDELLLVMPYEKAAATVAVLNDKLAGSHFLAADVSDARASFRLTGPRATEVLQKLAPADFATMAEGEVRRSRLAQVAAAMWQSGPEEWSVVCFRSVAGYVMGLLENAARPGAELGL